LKYICVLKKLGIVSRFNKWVSKWTSSIYMPFTHNFYCNKCNHDLLFKK
jgi:Fe2+ or Zn2+ uptake regulation protein